MTSDENWVFHAILPYKAKIHICLKLEKTKCVLLSIMITAFKSNVLKMQKTLARADSPAKAWQLGY